MTTINANTLRPYLADKLVENRITLDDDSHVLDWAVADKAAGETTTAVLAAQDGTIVAHGKLIKGASGSYYAWGMDEFEKVTGRKLEPPYLNVQMQATQLLGQRVYEVRLSHLRGQSSRVARRDQYVRNARRLQQKISDTEDYLTELQASRNVAIRDAVNEGVSMYRVAKEIGLTQSQVQRIMK